MSVWSVVVGVVTLLSLSLGDPVEICISEVKATECYDYGKLVNKHKLKLDPDNIKVFEVLADGSKQEAKSIKLPGKYQLEFRRVTVTEDMDFLIGDISARLGNIIQAVPSAGASCSSEAVLVCNHKVEGLATIGVASNVGLCLNGPSACRYCDLCKTTKSTEKDLEDKNVINSGNSGKFPAECTEIRKGNTYSITRSITLPDQDKLDLGWLKTKDSSKDSAVADAFKKKVNKMTISLNLLNKPQPKSCDPKCKNPLTAKLPLSNCGGCDTTDQCQKASSSDSKFDLVGCYNIDFKFDYQSEIGKCPGATGSDSSGSRSKSESSGSNSNSRTPSTDVNNRFAPASSGFDPCKSEKPFCCGCIHCSKVGCGLECTRKDKSWCDTHGYENNKHG